MLLYEERGGGEEREASLTPRNQPAQVAIPRHAHTKLTPGLGGVGVGGKSVPRGLFDGSVELPLFFLDAGYLVRRHALLDEVGVAATHLGRLGAASAAAASVVGGRRVVRLGLVVPGGRLIRVGGVLALAGLMQHGGGGAAVGLDMHQLTVVAVGTVRRLGHAGRGLLLGDQVGGAVAAGGTGGGAVGAAGGVAAGHSAVMVGCLIAPAPHEEEHPQGRAGQAHAAAPHGDADAGADAQAGWARPRRCRRRQRGPPGRRVRAGRRSGEPRLADRGRRGRRRLLLLLREGLFDARIVYWWHACPCDGEIAAE